MGDRRSADDGRGSNESSYFDAVPQAGAAGFGAKTKLEATARAGRLGARERNRFLGGASNKSFTIFYFLTFSLIQA